MSGDWSPQREQRKRSEPLARAAGSNLQFGCWRTSSTPAKLDFLADRDDFEGVRSFFLGVAARLAAFFSSSVRPCSATRTKNTSSNACECGRKEDEIQECFLATSRQA